MTKPVVERVEHGAEYTHINGVEYSRYIIGGHGHFWTTAGKTALEEDENPVVCECGNTSFTLRYGVYEIKAHCVECGIEEVVYDG